VTQGEAFRAECLYHGVVLLEVAKCFENELQKFSLSLVVLNKRSFLQPFQLNQPLLNCVLEIA
jgi:hypothetical protein